MLKNNQLLQLMMFIGAFSTNIFSMMQLTSSQRAAIKRMQKSDVSLQSKQNIQKDFASYMRLFKQKSPTQEILKQHENQLFLYDVNNPKKGLWVDKKLAVENSELISEVVGMYKDQQSNEIPIDCSIDKIQQFFSFCKTKEPKEFTLKELVVLANTADYLEAIDIQKIALANIKINSDTINSEEIKELNFDLQISLMRAPTTHCLKDLIIKSNQKDRIKVLCSVDASVHSAIFSSDGNKIAAIPFFPEGILFKPNLLICTKNEEVFEIAGYHVGNYLKCFYSVDFSSDENKVVLAGDPDSNGYNVYEYDLVTKIQKPLFSINDIFMVKFLSKSDDIYVVVASDSNVCSLCIINFITGDTVMDLSNDNIDSYSLDCSADGKIIVVGYEGKEHNLALYDMSKVDLKNPQQSDLKKHILAGTSGTITLNTVSSVAISPDKSKIVSGSKDGKLVLWDISDFNKIMSKELADRTLAINSVKFSHDSKSILVGLEGSEKNNLELWYIDDFDKIICTVLPSIENNIVSVDFNFDDSQILVGGRMSSSLYSSFPTLILRTLWTDKEADALKELKDYSADELQFIYALCLNKFKDWKAKLNEDNSVFQGLSRDMQNVLRDLAKKNS
ncbi:MAG TPA: WD40 repeat domain-containing protein [Candidatus Babeliales bacterium]|nr:WD40 repeat domain-containing protein [Candidatus Babeliales bacterium]